MEEKRFLLLERRGNEFMAHDDIRNHSDIGNYRLTTPGYTVPGKDGKTYFLEISALKRRDLPYAAYIDTAYLEKSGDCRRDLELEKKLSETPRKYTQAGILELVNSFSAVKYDAIKYVHAFNVEIQPGENFTPAGMIYKWAKANRIPETITKYGEKRYRLYSGLYQYHSYRIQKSNDREVVTFLLERIAE